MRAQDQMEDVFSEAFFFVLNMTITISFIRHDAEQEGGNVERKSSSLDRQK